MALVIKDLRMERSRESGSAKVVSKTPQRFIAGKFSNIVADTISVL